MQARLLALPIQQQQQRAEISEEDMVLSRSRSSLLVFCVRVVAAELEGTLKLTDTEGSNVA